MKDGYSNGIISAENPESREGNGVEVLVRKQRAITGAIRIQPYYPDVEVSEGVWQLPSLTLDRIPSWMATVEPGYRSTVPYYSPGGRQANQELQARMKEFDPSYIWINGDQPTAEQVAIAAYELGIPYGVQNHTDWWFYIRTRVSLPFQPSALLSQWRRSRWVHQHAALSVAPSKLYADKLAKLGIEVNEVFPSTVNLISLMNGDQKREYRQWFFLKYKKCIPWELRNHDIFVVLGRVSDEKGLDKSVSAHAASVGRCKNEADKPILVFAGECHEQCRLKLLALAEKLGTSHLIFFLGYMDHGEAMKFLQICQFCLFLSLSETQGLVLEEALLAKVLTIVSAGTPLHARLKDESRLVFPNDPRQIGERINWFRSRPDLMKEISERQYQQAVQVNDPQRYTKQFTNYIDRVIMSGRK